MSNNITFFNLKNCHSLKERNKLKYFLNKIFKEEKRKLKSLNYIFCTDKYLLEINRDYLKHDYFTDIITFNLGSPMEIIEGEVYISIDRVRENARKFGVSIKKEIHRVIFHGALHLCGYSDKSKSEIVQMRKKEEEYLKKYFYRP